MIKLALISSALLIIIRVALFASGSATPGAPPPGTPPPPACVSPEFRRFDFWIGRWKVISPEGVQVGTSEITRAADGCAVREEWKSARGGSGTSINYFDAADGQWHQELGRWRRHHPASPRWMERGCHVILTGKSKDGQGPIVNRITWTPLPEGKEAGVDRLQR
ncbi:MAG: hypothetical protein M3Q89_04790 [Verrucomicrobiota bacterium]|nr:hypothetical protein [Verrucomicrobiota bacterium]